MLTIFSRAAAHHGWCAFLILWVACAVVISLSLAHCRRRGGLLKKAQDKQKYWLKRTFWVWLGYWVLGTSLVIAIGLGAMRDHFNSRLSDSGLVLLPVIGIAYLIAMRVVRSATFDGWYFFDSRDYFTYLRNQNSGEFLDPKDIGDTFEAHSQRYTGLAKLTISFAAGAIAFIINTLVNAKADSPEVMKGLRTTAPIAVGFFGFSVSLLIIFMVVQALWYEEYRCSPQRNTYKYWKYAVCLSTGWTGLIAFGTGVFWLGVNLFQSN